VENGIANGAVHSISLGGILDVIDAHREDVRFAVRLENIKRINSWANIYMHSGIRAASYSWCPPRVLSYLRGFILGQLTPSWGHNINAGVRLPRDVFDDIRSQISNDHSGKLRRPWWCVQDWFREAYNAGAKVCLDGDQGTGHPQALAETQCTATGKIPPHATLLTRARNLRAPRCPK
jgi:hypothetical protein